MAAADPTIGAVQAAGITAHVDAILVAGGVVNVD
jgi:hypothetical protein